jgi:ribulose-phosphate 3-epimerase
MSVEPGFGGQSFMPSAYEKITELKNRRTKLNAHFQIQVDGGISNKNCNELKKAGADNLVAGSYIFKAPQQDYAKQVASLA